jgi:hypothetical protein
MTINVAAILTQSLLRLQRCHPFATLEIDLQMLEKSRLNI